jgi:outer membrane receptor protein involved in Fe transport
MLYAFRFIQLANCALVTALPLICATVRAEGIEEIRVTARLREAPAQSVPASISVLPAAAIRARQAQHLQEMLDAAPNVNFSQGASRGRFVQLRGIGERSQFVDPVDPSVGLYIDGIDFSGMGNAGTLFDAAQVEILRGPQGTAFGASALAGLVNIRSTDPATDPGVRLRLGASEYGGSTLGLSAGGPLAAGLAGRLALERYRSDGYVRNTYLGRDNTNAIDEGTVRARLAWEPDEDLSFGLTALRVDADNGYDAFSLDNTRHTLSDEPGKDAQTSNALALDAAWRGMDAADLRLLATWSKSDLDYGYDEDWSYPGICTGLPCEGYEYKSTDRYIREVDARSLDLRALSRGDGRLGWVAGLYAWRRDTTLERRFFDFAAGYPPPAARFDSDYSASRDAAYGELSFAASDRLTLVAGLRAEKFSADYDDSLNVASTPDDTLLGGQVSAQYALNDAAMVYAQVSRGFKAGGVNGEAIGKARQAALSPSIISFLEDRREFSSEVLWNYEIGWKARFADDRARIALSLFAMEREDVQLKAWYNEGPQFVGYTDNAASGENRGLELEFAWQPVDALSLDGALGLLDTEIDGFVANDPDLGFVDKSGRDQAQAPNWQFHVAGEWRFAPHFYARVEWEGKDAYYFSDSDNQRSDAYTLLHLSAGYRGKALDVSAWLRNALDQTYATHGFYFGNDPRKFYVNEPYYQFGAPRVAGISIDYHFGG